MGIMFVFSTELGRDISVYILGNTTDTFFIADIEGFRLG